MRLHVDSVGSHGEENWLIQDRHGSLRVDAREGDRALAIRAELGKNGSSVMRPLPIFQNTAPMIWFFTRDSAQVDIEVRRLPDAGLYELVIDYPDGSEEVERFRNPRKLVKRTLMVQQRLIQDGWMPTGPGRHRPRVMWAAPQGRARGLKAVPRRVWSYVQRQVTRRIAATWGL